MEVVNFYVDETKFSKEGIDYLALALVLIKSGDNVEQIERNIIELKKELAGDQFLAHDYDDRLFHFVEDSLEIQPRLIEKIRDFVIRGYIAFHPFSGTRIKDTYLKILFKLLNERISAYSEYQMNLFYEEQSEITEPDIKSLLDDILNIHSGVNITAVKTTKDNVLICLPDYLLGVFRDIAHSEKKKLDYMYRNFEKLRSKIRLIIDMEHHIFYHKDNPYK